MPDDSMELQVTLQCPEELFAEPDADPFDPASRYQSGIDEVVGKLRLHPRDLGRTSRLTVRLPAAEITADTQATIRAALERHCAAKIAENRQVIAELRVGSGWQAISAMVLSAALIMVGVLLVYSVPGLEKVSGAIGAFIAIAIWVLLWDPIYNYIYAWRPNRQEIRIFDNLRQCDLSVEAV